MLRKEQIKKQQLHRESEDDEADSDNVPVYYRYPFVKQITAAVRRIGRSKYCGVNMNTPIYLNIIIFSTFHAIIISLCFSGIRHYLYEFSETMLPKKGAIARIINAISNVNPITGRTFSAKPYHLIL